MASPCSACGAKKAHSVHLRAVGLAGYHAYQDASRPGLKPMSEGMAEFRKASGYDAAAKAAQGLPCQIVSPVCTGTAQHLHEPLPRGRAGGLKASLRDGPQPIQCCDQCNTYVSEHQVWARERGFIVSRP